MVNTFLNQTYGYILAVFNGKSQKVILFSKINRFYDQWHMGLDTQRFYQKMNYNYITRFKFCLSLWYWYSPALPWMNLTKDETQWLPFLLLQLLGILNIKISRKPLQQSCMLCVWSFKSEPSPLQKLGSVQTFILPIKCTLGLAF